MQVMQLQNQEAEALTGVKSFSGGLSGSAYGDLAAGVRGLLDAASKREMSILRRLAQGIKEIGVKTIAMNAVFLSETEVVRVTNDQFVEIQREDLKGNYDLVVDIATAEVDNAKSQDLAFMLQTLGPNMDTGINMMILSEIATLKRMPVLAHKLATFKPEPDPVQQEIQQLELEKLRSEVALLSAETELKVAQAKKAASEANINNLDYVEQETGTKHMRDIDKQKAQSEGNQNLAITKALVKPSKADESEPNVKAAIGFKALSAQMENAGQSAGTSPTLPIANQVNDSSPLAQPTINQSF
jgi:hypothetical protein